MKLALQQWLLLLLLYVDVLSFSACLCVCIQERGVSYCLFWSFEEFEYASTLRHVDFCYNVTLH